VTPDERARLDELLRVPSVSADPAHAPDMRRAAELVAEEVRAAGGDAEVGEGPGHPLVLGEVAPPGRPGAPRVLVYGHYDVQPPGDADLWESDPFTPTIRGEHLYARGASDDKGNLFMLLVAVRRLAERGALGVRVSFVIDGEEESGGTSAEDHLAADPESADAAIIFDVPMLAPGHPVLVTGTRGLVYRRLTVRTGDRDGHSGLFGGAAMNAAGVLAGMLARLGPVDGRAPEPLRAGLPAPDPAEVAGWAELPGGDDVLAEGGLRPADPVAADELYLRTTAEPALDVHALAAGVEDAVRTSIPVEASAMLSLRVAPGQDAERLAVALDDLVAEVAPAGAEVTLEPLGTARPALVDPGAPPIRAAAAALERAVGRAPVLARSGGTLPVVAGLAARGTPVVLTGFGLPDDAIHAPNERILVENLTIGTRAAEEILLGLGVH
jgi:acetylornithine deacetylase/succinyl-diaminopimelate desuccinylase-like protein